MKSTGIQRFYQVEIPGNRYLQLDLMPVNESGRANFINSALRPKDNLDEALSVQTSQNMKEVQCELIWSKTGFSKRMKERYPAYVKVIKAIPQGDELLMRYGSSYKMGSAEDDEEPR